MSAERLTERQRQSIADVCRRQGISLCYLFGSQVTGHADAASDWDFGVVFAAGERRQRSVDHWLDVVADFEATLPGLTLDIVFLQDAPTVLQNEAIQGVLLHASSELARADFEEDVMRRWMDLCAFIEAQERDEEEAVLSGHFFG